jgi:dipeptidyl aminopeptidase/acylaminoacyl peptidase
MALLLSVTVTASACTLSVGTDRGEGRVTPPPSTGTSPTQAGPATTAPPAPDGRLAVISEDGVLSTILPDGTDPVPLTDPSLTRVVTAAWSPDGTHLAWSELSAGGPVLSVAGPRGEGRVSSTIPFGAFYLSWDPAGRKVALLGSAGESVAVAIARHGDAGLEVRPPLGEGQPSFFFSWDPRGRLLLTHVGLGLVEELGLDGDRRPLSRRGGVFQTPVLTPDGRTAIYVERVRDGRQRLLLRTGSREPRVLLSARGSIFFVLSPDGRRLALQVLGPNEQDLFDREQQAPGGDVGVDVVDLRSGRRERITRFRAGTFSWSPDGRRLLVFAPDYAPTGTIPFRWSVWDGRGLETTGPVLPSLALLRDWAPFFTQFEQSMTLWAPDGRAFAYPGETPGGRSAIWVQPIGEGPPRPVAAGVFVAWSPVR